MTSWPHSDFPEQVRLKPLGHLPAATHVFTPREVWAIKAALGARRPLLVRGEPGTGKSQLARATASVLKRPLVSEVVTARTEPSDLLYRFDAVARLGQAQLMGVAGAGAKVPERATSEVTLEALDERRFLLPGPLWWVFDWQHALDQRQAAQLKGAKPHVPEGWQVGQGTVLLIDEIDKADADLPNGLLESLGNGEFHVPYLDEPVGTSAGEPQLVVITTNEERELPAAFVRRCLVLELKLPAGAELEALLEKRGRAHFGEACSPELYQRAAQLLVADRESEDTRGPVRPGQAEYLDLLRAVLNVAKQSQQSQLELLSEVSEFTLKKNPTTDF